MKWASRLAQLAMFSNWRNDCRRCKEEGQRRLAAGWKEKPHEVGRRLGTCLALCSYGTCRCRCSSSKGFYQPREREVTSNSFGIAHLHCAFPRRSLQDYGSVGKKKKRLAHGGSWADWGETRAKAGPALRGNVDATNSGEAHGSSCDTTAVSVHVLACLNMPALCRQLSLICMWPSLLCSSAWGNIAGLICYALVTFLECYLLPNKHRPYFRNLRGKCLIININL